MPELLAQGRRRRLMPGLVAAWVAFAAAGGAALAQTVPAQPAPAQPDAVVVVEPDAVVVDAEHPAEEHGGGLPQLNPEVFGPQLVWLAITFAALYFLMSKVALPRIAEVLEERQERIGDDLEKAARLKEEAEQVVAGYEKALAEARTQAQAVIAKAVEEMQAAAQARQAQFAADLAAKTRAAEQRIAAAKDAALANVRTIAADVAQDVVGKISGVKVDPAAAEDAVAAVVKERA